MKPLKYVVLIIMVGFMLSGCAGFQIQAPSPEDMVWTSGNLIGFHAIRKYKEYAKKGEKVAQDILALESSDSIGDTLNPLLLELSLYLTEEKDLDPIIVHGLNLLLPMIHVKPGAVPEDKVKLIKSAASGYLAGVEAGRNLVSRFPTETEENRLALQEID